MRSDALHCLYSLHTLSVIPGIASSDNYVGVTLTRCRDCDDPYLDRDVSPLIDRHPHLNRKTGTRSKMQNVHRCRLRYIHIARCPNSDLKEPQNIARQLDSEDLTSMLLRSRVQASHSPSMPSIPTPPHALSASQDSPCPRRSRWRHLRPLIHPDHWSRSRSRSRYQGGATSPIRCTKHPYSLLPHPRPPSLPLRLPPSYLSPAARPGTIKRRSSLGPPL